MLGSVIRYLAIFLIASTGMSYASEARISLHIARSFHHTDAEFDQLSVQDDEKCVVPLAEVALTRIRFKFQIGKPVNLNQLDDVGYKIYQDELLLFTLTDNGYLVNGTGEVRLLNEDDSTFLFGYFTALLDSDIC